MQMKPLSIPVMVSLFSFEKVILWNVVTDGLWYSMSLKWNCFLSIAIEMNGIEMQEEISFRLLGYLYSIYGLKPYTQSISKAASRKVSSLYRAQHFLIPESILYLYKSTSHSCMEYCSHIWGGALRSDGLDLLDRVQKRVVSLVSSRLSTESQALLHRRDVASLSLFYKYYHGKCSSPKHVDVRSTHFSEQIHRHTDNSLMCSFINHAVFLALQPFGTPSLMNAFHQITISQHSRGGLTRTCCIQWLRDLYEMHKCVYIYIYIYITRNIFNILIY